MNKKEHILDTQEAIFGFMHLIDEIKNKFTKDSVLTENNYQDIEISIKSSSEDIISDKTIGRAFDFRRLFTGIKPSKTTLDILTRYLTEGNVSNFKFFINEIENAYLKDYASEYKSILDKHKIEEQDESISVNDFIDLKQKNILSAFNSSKIEKIKGKISQLNILGFGNKQEIGNNNDKTKK